MKALSIKQPWAHAILNCGKNIENRTWRTNYRGKLLIHAGKNIDKESYYFLHYQMKIHVPEDAALLVGGIVGIVEIVECVSSSASPWFSGPFGFVLSNPVTLPFFPCPGRLGFFDVPYPF